MGNGAGSGPRAQGAHLTPDPVTKCSWRARSLEGMAQITSDPDRDAVGGGHGRNREEGTDSEEGQGRVLEQSPGVQRERSRSDTVNLKIERSSGIGTR